MPLDDMAKINTFSPEERYRLIGKLIEEIKLRKYSYQTGKLYISVVKKFLSSGLTSKGCHRLVFFKSVFQPGKVYISAKNVV